MVSPQNVQQPEDTVTFCDTSLHYFVANCEDKFLGDFAMKYQQTVDVFLGWIEILSTNWTTDYSSFCT